MNQQTYANFESPIVFFADAISTQSFYQTAINLASS